MAVIRFEELSRPLQAAIEERSRKEGKSIDQAMIAMLEQFLGVTAQPSAISEFDALCGAWTEEEFQQFQEFLAKERQIDAELWS